MESSSTEQEAFESFPIGEETDTLILMHRDAHFGGQFAVMLDYYEQEGIGVHRELPLKRIHYLAAIEKRSDKNLAAQLLTGPDAERIGKSKEAYKRLRDLYDQEETEKNQILLLIADLILSEEKHPREEIAAIVAKKGAIVPALIEVLSARDLYDPLFPGYGRAPNLAAHCLSEIGDKRALISLFETLNQDDFTHESVAIKGLKAIGEPAKEFLLRVLKSHPFTNDNENAVIALLEFGDDPDIAKACFKLLQEKGVLENIPFATYLIMGCVGLEGSAEETAFRLLAESGSVPKPLRQDFTAILHQWSV